MFREGAPDVGHQGEDLGFGLLQFAGDEGEEVVRAKIGLGYFGEELHLIR
jgi:hypothetical protein